MKNYKYGKWILFFVCILSLFFVYDYHKVLPSHPQSTHTWRQCDGSSIALMYVRNNLNPFQPEVYNQFVEGKGVGEFPIIYYLDACIIKIVGEKHANLVIRLVNLLIFYLGLLYLYKIGLLLFKNPLLAILPVILFHSFPIIVFYAVTSLPNVPAISIAFIGAFYLIKFLKTRENRDFGIAICITALAGMIKPPTLLLFLSFNVFLWLAYLFKERTYRLKLNKLVLLLLLPIAATLCWVLIAGKYNRIHQSVFFLMETKPIWALDKAHIDLITNRIKKSWIFDYLYIPMLIWIIVVGLIYTLRPTKKQGTIKLSILALLLGTTLYFYLFF